MEGGYGQDMSNEGLYSNLRSGKVKKQAMLHHGCVGKDYKKEQVDRKRSEELTNRNCGSLCQVHDPLLNNNVSSGEHLVGDAMRNQDTLLKDMIKVGRKSFSDFEIITLNNVPQQPNLYDCGIYVINFMERRESMLRPVLYHSDDEKARLARKIMKSSCNKLKGEVESLVSNRS
ncbi:Ulp1 protease family, C-terminal catalytic domain containing protein [Trema orientale]|uniref:Ulp1 protease family, C-terminal catalytic domain containing protein n=1 Tax=Trema orientale TaxID=63057 RepID=A0A2P5FNS8_TREOI|nr:Ulp1 protease family, C-terminal catalytic domain containing protein [Trema orientale]